MPGQGTLAGLRRRLRFVAGRIAGKRYFKSSAGAPEAREEPPGPVPAFIECQDPSHGDDDALTAFRARLANVGDEAEFARHFRARCIHFYWLLLSAARLAETIGQLRSGVGRGTFDLPWTIACLAFWLFFAHASASGAVVSHRIVDLSHFLVLTYMAVCHVLMLVYITGLSESQSAEERRNLYAYSAHPVYYAFCFLLGFFMPLTCSGEVKVQCLFVCENLGASLALIRIGGADPRRFTLQFSTWAAAVLVSNGAIYGVLKPLWMCAQARVPTSDARLKQRVEQLGREKERLAWELELATAWTTDSDDGGVPESTSAPESTDLSLTSSFVRDIQSDVRGVDAKKRDPPPETETRPQKWADIANDPRL